MKNITIRKAHLSDLEVIQSLNQELCKKEHNEFDDTIDPNYPFTSKGQTYFSFRLESPDSFSLLVICDEVAVGYLVGGIVETEDYRTPLIVAEVENMYIKPEYRQGGIGSQLLQQFDDWCKKQNVQRIRYIASAANAKAIKFYKANGAEEISVTLEKEL